MKRISGIYGQMTLVGVLLLTATSCAPDVWEQTNYHVFLQARPVRLSQIGLEYIKPNEMRVPVTIDSVPHRVIGKSTPESLTTIEADRPAAEAACEVARACLKHARADLREDYRHDGDYSLYMVERDGERTVEVWRYQHNGLTALEEEDARNGGRLPAAVIWSRPCGEITAQDSTIVGYQVFRAIADDSAKRSGLAEAER